ncbi:MAG TPA: EthD domain-containing protein [Candidatus Binataceae bacterium]|nr:EthD domain-containing protein [Candidatus Binataceae bacterium]
MLKIVYCISKLPHLSDEEFHRYWRDVHGPIASRIPGCRKYVQCHSIYRGKTRPPFDGTAEMWLDDWEAYKKAMGSPEVKAALEDEKKFIDHSHTAFFVTEEHQVV